MRTPLSRAALVGASSVALATALAAAPQAELERSQGLIGGTVDYAITGGDPFQLFVLMPSFETGPLPLALIDPTDPRVLSIGLDLQTYWTTGALDAAGSAAVSYPLPNSPALQGLPHYAQALTIPGATTLVDDVTGQTAVALAAAGTSVLTVGDMPVVLQGNTATALADGRVLIAGGGGTDGAGVPVSGDGLYLFDPQTQGFSAAAATMGTDRAAHTATLLADGRVLLLGGSDALQNPLASGDIWDPVTDTVTAIAPMPTPRLLHTATLLDDGRVFVAGGANGFDLVDPLAGLGNVLASTAVYDPVANSWSGGPSFPNPRAGHRASKLNDGRVLLTGGLEVTQIIFIGNVPIISADCRVYNPSNNSLAGVADFSGARALHAQVTLPDGRVLVAGGGTIDFLSLSISTLNTARLYDPGSNTWTAVPSLAQARAYADAFVVDGPRVVVAGGLGTVDQSTGSGTPADLFETSALTFGGWSATPPVVARSIPVFAVVDGGQRLLMVGPDFAATGVPPVDLSAETFVP